MKIAIKYIPYILLFLFCTCPKKSVDNNAGVFDKNWGTERNSRIRDMEKFDGKTLISCELPEAYVYFKFYPFINRIQEYVYDSLLAEHITDEYIFLSRELDTIPVDILKDHLDYFLKEKGEPIYYALINDFIKNLNCMVFDKMNNRFINKVIILIDFNSAGPLAGTPIYFFQFTRGNTEIMFYSHITDSTKPMILDDGGEDED